MLCSELKQAVFYRSIWVDLAGFRVEVKEPSDADAPCHNYNHKGTD